MTRAEATRLVNRFNKAFPKGSEVKWRNHRDAEYETVTVRREAFIADSGHPVTFFNEKSGYCSIGQAHVAYHLGEGPA